MLKSKLEMICYRKMKISLRQVRELISWRGAGLAFAIVSVAGIVSLLALAPYVRPLQDDFWYYRIDSANSFRDSVQTQYGWSGRLTSSTFFVLIGGFQLYWLVPIIGIGLLAFLGFRIASLLLEKMPIKDRKGRYVFLCALLSALPVGLFLATPSPYSTYYWLSAAPVHLWSYALLGIIGTYLYERLTKNRGIQRWKDTITFIALVLTGLMSEMAALTIIIVSAVILLHGLILKRDRLYRIGLLLSGIISLGFLYFSPGSLHRRAAEHTTSLTDVMPQFKHVIKENVLHLFSTGITHKSVLILALLAGVIVGLALLRTTLKRMTAVASVTLAIIGVLIATNYMIVYYAVQHLIVWDRTQVFAVLLVLGGFFAVGAWLGVAGRALINMLKKTQKQKRQYVKIVHSILVLLGMGVFAVEFGSYSSYILHFSQTVKQRASDFDARSQLINEIQKTGHCRPLDTTTLYHTQEGFDIVKGEPAILNVRFYEYYRLPCYVEGDTTMHDAQIETDTVRKQ